MDRKELATPRLAAPPGGAAEAELIVQIGAEVELANALSKNGRDPHPIVYALARAWNGATNGESDGLYGADSEGYTALVARRADHFTIVRFGRVGTDDPLPTRAVLRILRLANRVDELPELALDEAVDAVNHALEPEGIHLHAIPPALRPEAMALAGRSGRWEDLAPRERTKAARAYAEAKLGARSADLVVSGWSERVARDRLFEFVENLPA